MPPTFAVYSRLSGVASVSAGSLAPIRGPSGSVSLTAQPLLSCLEPPAWRLKESRVHPKITAQPMAPTDHDRYTPNSVVKSLTYFKISLIFLNSMSIFFENFIC